MYLAKCFYHTLIYASLPMRALSWYRVVFKHTTRPVQCQVKWRSQDIAKAKITRHVKNTKTYNNYPRYIFILQLTQVTWVILVLRFAYLDISCWAMTLGTGTPASLRTLRSLQINNIYWKIWSNRNNIDAHELIWTNLHSFCRASVLDFFFRINRCCPQLNRYVESGK